MLHGRLSICQTDAYFHVSVLPPHRPFLRFAFEGWAYQYKVLPFGLSLPPRIFTKVVEADLVPMREHGVRILNYLDDWLIPAQSRDQLCEHRDMVLSHLSQLGLGSTGKRANSLQCRGSLFLVWSWTRSTRQHTPQRNVFGQSGADLVNWGPQANIGMGPYTFSHIYLDQL